MAGPKFDRPASCPNEGAHSSGLDKMACFRCPLWPWSRILRSRHDPADCIGTSKIGYAAELGAGGNTECLPTPGLERPCSGKPPAGQTMSASDNRHPMETCLNCPPEHTQSQLPPGGAADASSSSSHNRDPVPRRGPVFCVHPAPARATATRCAAVSHSGRRGKSTRLAVPKRLPNSVVCHKVALTNRLAPLTLAVAAAQTLQSQPLQQ